MLKLSSKFDRNHAQSEIQHAEALIQEIKSKVDKEHHNESNISNLSESLKKDINQQSQIQDKLSKSISIKILQQFKKHPQAKNIKRIKIVKQKRQNQIVNQIVLNKNIKQKLNQENFQRLRSLSQHQRNKSLGVQSLRTALSLKQSYKRSQTQLINQVQNKEFISLFNLIKSKSYLNEFQSKQLIQVKQEENQRKQKLSLISDFYDKFKQNKISDVVQKYSFKDKEQLPKLNTQKSDSNESEQEQSQSIRNERFLDKSKNTLFCYLKRPKLLQNPEQMSKNQIQEFLTNPFHKNQEVKQQLRFKKRQMVKKSVKQIIQSKQNRNQSRSRKSSINSINSKSSKLSFKQSTQSLLINNQKHLQSQKISQSLNQKSKQIIINVLKMQKLKNAQQLNNLKFVPFNSFLSLDRKLQTKIQQNFHVKRCNKLVEKISLQKMQQSSIQLKHIKKTSKFTQY